MKEPGQTDTNTSRYGPFLVPKTSFYIGMEKLVSLVSPLNRRFNKNRSVCKLYAPGGAVSEIRVFFLDTFEHASWFPDHFDPFWHLFGTFGSFRALLGPKWDQHRVISGWFWTIFGPFWCHFGMILPSSWHRFGIVLVRFWPAWTSFFLAVLGLF